MKKRVLAIFLCLALLCNVADAQLRIGIAGGPQLSSVPGSLNPGWDTLQYKHNSRLGWRAGVVADMRLGQRSPIHLQSGLFFSTKGQRFSLKYDSANNGVNEVRGFQYTNYFEVPLQLIWKVKLGKNTRVVMGGGAYAGFLFNGTEEKRIYQSNNTVQTSRNTDLKIPIVPGDYPNMEYGVNGLFGFEFGRVILNGHYSQGITEFYTSDYAGGNFRHRTMSVSLGYYIFESKGKAQRQKNRVRDKDKDSVADEVDECPTEAGTVATGGCPDSDGDGVADKVDKCAQVAGKAKYKGCPVPDTDKDGINDEEDRCPETAGLKKYQGCPAPDADKDGITDEEDKCPQAAGNAKYQGCPVPDTDKDGVNDEEDKCPKTKGLKENQGCPVIKKAIVTKVETAARRIQFNYKSILLLPQSKKVLNEVVKILKENPELNVAIYGHTSSDGNPNNHYRLSYARAYSVKIYLESKGISPFRVTAEGMGATQPLVKGNSEKALARNRRVEMRLSSE
jgi:outer membrane protein OmpA-like peptidoglycan-associated protein